MGLQPSGLGEQGCGKHAALEENKDPLILAATRRRQPHQLVTGTPWDTPGAAAWPRNAASSFPIKYIQESNGTWPSSLGTVGHIGPWEAAGHLWEFPCSCLSCLLWEAALLLFLKYIYFCCFPSMPEKVAADCI